MPTGSKVHTSEVGKVELEMHTMEGGRGRERDTEREKEGDHLCNLL
jgi:hypothetical protein